MMLSQISFNKIFPILYLIGILVLFGLVFRQYKRLKYKNLRYFLFSLIFLIIGSSPQYAFGVSGTTPLAALFRGNMNSIFLLNSIFFMILFFESFQNENPLNKRNIIFMSLNILIITALLTVFILFMITFFNLPLDSIGVLSEEAISPSQSLDLQLFDSTMTIMIITFLILSFTAALFAAIETIFLLIHIHWRIKRAISPIQKKTFIQLRIGIYLLGFSLILQPFGNVLIIFEYLHKIVLLFGFGLLTRSLIQHGFTIFQENDLRRLLLINKQGMTFFSYRFRNFENAANNENDELLFSGALNAVSTIFQELTGNSTNKIREINFDTIQMIVTPTKNQDFFAVLLTDRASNFYREALEKFAYEVMSVIGLVSSIQMLKHNQQTEVEELIIKYFGICWKEEL
ncbi:hypothetical protein [Candidatus Harpocratesius sp.]